MKVLLGRERGEAADDEVQDGFQGVFLLADLHQQGEALLSALHEGRGIRHILQQPGHIMKTLLFI